MDSFLSPLIEGLDPPDDALFEAEDIPCEYPPCKKCGASHGMGVKNMRTGKIDPLDKCYDCFWEDAFVYTPPKEKIRLDQE